MQSGWTVSALIARSIRPVAAMGAAVLAVSCIAQLDQPDPTWRTRHAIYALIDIRREGTVGTWFESALFLLCGLAAADLGWRRGLTEVIGAWRVWFLRCLALGCTVLSLDEAAQLHEQIGQRIEKSTGVFEGQAIDGIGFSWVLVHGVPAIVATVFVIILFSRMVPGPRRGGTRVAFTLMAITPPSVIALEILEGLAWAHGNRSTFLTCIEETCEIVGLVAFLVLTSAAVRRLQCGDIGREESRSMADTSPAAARAVTERQRPRIAGTPPTGTGPRRSWRLALPAFLAAMAVYSCVLLGIQARGGDAAVRPYVADITGSVRLASINTTLSVMFLWGAGLLCLLPLAAPGGTSVRNRRLLVGLALVFAYLGFDDRFLVHEFLSVRFGLSEVVTFGVMGTALGALLWFHRDLWRAYPSARRWLYVAGGATVAMLAVDVGAPEQMPMRVATEDVLKVWGSLSFALFAWNLCVGEVWASRGDAPAFEWTRRAEEAAPAAAGVFAADRDQPADVRDQQPVG